MSLSVTALGDVPSVILQDARSVLTDRFDTSVIVQDGMPLPRDAFDGARDQFDAKRLVQATKSESGPNKTLALTPADLFMNERNYLFGLAEFEGSAGVVSFNRLTKGLNEAETTDTETARSRLRKEIIHEVGHLFGYRHCSNDRCVMGFSTDVAQIDQKFERFCRGCGPP